MPAVKTGTGPWGKAIKYWLPRRDMRNADLARATGIEEKTIGKMARGFHTTTRKLEAVARALKVSLEDVLVSPEVQKANETLDRRIREAVSAAMRDHETAIAPGYDALMHGIEQQSAQEEAPTPMSTPVTKRSRHKRKK